MPGSASMMMARPPAPLPPPPSAPAPAPAPFFCISVSSRPTSPDDRPTGFPGGAASGPLPPPTPIDGEQLARTAAELLALLRLKG
jgi:hypothetical protein